MERAIKTRPTWAEKQHDRIRIGSVNKNPVGKGNLCGVQSRSLQTAWARKQSHEQWAGALSSQGKKKKTFIQLGVQTEQTEHQDQACAVLSSQHLNALTFSRAPTFSGEGTQSLGAKDNMRTWWAHNNQKRKGAKKVMEGGFSGEGALLSVYAPTHVRLLRREPQSLGAKNERSTQQPKVCCHSFSFSSHKK